MSIRMLSSAAAAFAAALCAAAPAWAVEVPAPEPFSIALLAGGVGLAVWISGRFGA